MANSRNVVGKLRHVINHRRRARRMRSRILGLAILGAIVVAAFGSAGSIEARVPASDPRTTYEARYCGKLQDAWDQLNAQYRQRKQQNPNDPALAGLRSDMQAIEYRWDQQCRELFGNIWFVNPALLDAVAGTNLTLSPANDGGGNGGMQVHDVTRVKGTILGVR
jgi:hypothetical protein